MATHLDFEEQEQLDQLKALWKQYGTLIVCTLALVLAAWWGYGAWNRHQVTQAGKAGALFDQLERVTQTGDLEKAERVFKDLTARFQGTAYAQQAGLLLAKLQFEKGQFDKASASLGWVADHAIEAEYKTLARLRWAGVLIDQKKYTEALQQLELAKAEPYVALVADRRGDVLLAQGKTAEAVQAYQQARSAMDAALEYRLFVDAKLAALGVQPVAGAASGPRTEAAP